MRISKEKANKAAIAICKPLKDKCKAAEKKLNEYGTKIVKSKIPRAIMMNFKKYPGYFKNSYGFNLQGTGITRYIYIVSEQPLPKISSYITLEKSEAIDIVKLQDALDAANTEYDLTLKEIQNTLTGLGTIKNIEKHMPEALKYIPEMVSSTQIAIPPTKVRNTVKELTKAATA